VSEETIRADNARANLALYGQEYNDESWAICCSDMLITDEETDHIVLGESGYAMRYSLARTNVSPGPHDGAAECDGDAGQFG